MATDQVEDLDEGLGVVQHAVVGRRLLADQCEVKPVVIELQVVLPRARLASEDGRGVGSRK